MFLNLIIMINLVPIYHNFYFYLTISHGLLPDVIIDTFLEYLYQTHMCYIHSV